MNVNDQNSQNTTQQPNTYLIPVTDPYGYTYKYYAVIHASNSDSAYRKAKNLPETQECIVSDDYTSYEIYKAPLSLPKTFFHFSEKSDIMFKTLSKTKGFEHMAYFQVDWNKYTTTLASKAAPENWSSPEYPDNKILANYMVKTYDKLTSEKKIIVGKKYALFNTGLFTKYYETIYAYQSGKKISFLTGYELTSMGIDDRPERANYFKHPELLLFDWHYPIDIQYKHILDDSDNKSRLPKGFIDNPNKIAILNGAIEIMKNKVSANYKLAVPQFYEGKIQLLLPLCLMDDNKPDVAITVTKTNNRYQGHTCLTLDMAYNNARLITKPESNWLAL